MADTLTAITTLTITSCGMCAVRFAMPEDMHRRVVETGARLWCPNGHQIHYSESENQRLTKQLSASQQSVQAVRAANDHQRELREAAIRRAAALKGVVTRTKNRIARGKCPCCHTRFANLAAHMQETHPGYGADE